MSNNIKIFHTLLSELNIREHKESILAGYGVESSKDLTDRQLDEIIEGLKKMKDSKHNAPRSIRLLRSHVLDLLTRLGVYKDNRDWTRVNKYLLQPRIAGKLMYEMNEEELNALIRKLSAISRKNDQKINEEKLWAIQN